MGTPGTCAALGLAVIEFQALASWGVCPVWASPFGHSVTVTGAPKWLQSSTPEGGDGVQEESICGAPPASSKKLPAEALRAPGRWLKMGQETLKPDEVLRMCPHLYLQT